MSGHSKWSKIKRKKGANDAKRSKMWARVTSEIMIAARDGGGSPDMNPKLALAIEKGKSHNMPKDNIERAIKRGTGEIEGADYEEVNLEGYGPGGVAVFVETLTDNNNRTVADVRHVFAKHGGNMGTSGSVSYLFDRKGTLEVPESAIAEDQLFELVVDAGAEDLVLEDGTFNITTPVEEFGSVQEALRAAELEVVEASLERVPTTTTLLEPDDARKVVRLIDALEDLADVQAVFTTLEFDEATLAAVSE